MGKQISIFDTDSDEGTQIDWLQRYRQDADLEDLGCDFNHWEIQKSNAQLGYLSHNFFRYFGKFPPPVAEKFIKELHDPAKGPVVDPTVGSGTTLVEAMLADTNAVGLDVNPLSCLVSKVKTTPIDREKIEGVLSSYQDFSKDNSVTGWKKYIPKDRYLDHWFYEETQESLGKLRLFIEEKVEDEDVEDLFRVGLAAIIRRVSRASNRLGRMFKDPDIPPQNVVRRFSKQIREMAIVCEQMKSLNSDIKVVKHDAKNPFPKELTTNLMICHPPYFNLYRYSSIYKFEMLWSGFEFKPIRKEEITEGFKKGKKELVHEYVDDLMAIIKNMAETTCADGWVVLMMGDTVIRDERINTTSLTLQKLSETDIPLKLKKVTIRKPKYTEASYAASQRRDKDQVGVSLSDHILVFQKDE
jgi:site-specific DNA-methyltransferase (cytosine-N4-specific)